MDKDFKKYIKCMEFIEAHPELRGRYEVYVKNQAEKEQLHKAEQRIYEASYQKALNAENGEKVNEVKKRFVEHFEAQGLTKDQIKEQYGDIIGDYI
ncbi:hypothetical protein WKH56_08700 [Priestia sp. SB1]|uniref:Uncharacterized protein n=1 Tax=Priestia aryabhattai TaxID=412384 RepID=A0AAX6NE99_PRIAR|nr:hypothetical protein [Priestia aryabhattai]MDU9693980.1 hypothetical protein [Priestia aryabhattai]NGY88723.1 hypothetical protein [Priestia megaterium]